MGIPRLRYHLYPFSQSVLLQGEEHVAKEDTRCIQSVVIDGPSLVYNVYARLLSLFSNSSTSLMDALPSCSEVSHGVMLYLLQLQALGVRIEHIYFDGALPAEKHETRILRLESSRRKLEVLCLETKGGFRNQKISRPDRAVEPESVLQSRPMPAKYDNVPANPFMVPAVFEDLKNRWTRENILQVARDVFPLHLTHLQDSPWAGITTMVPGEADAYCVHTARLTGASVLTNDSDLLLYDHRGSSSVIFLDSVELHRLESIQSSQYQIKAQMLCPSLIARRLGIPNLILLGYELKAHPELGMVDLLQRLKNMNDQMADRPRSYQHFAEEYQDSSSTQDTTEITQQIKHLDTRVSELYCQYELPHAYTTWDSLRMYLPVLTEDHARQCAWACGRSYRSVGYSILNLSRPVPERRSYITEFVRRGQRIAENRILLGDNEWMTAQVKQILSRLKSIRTELGRDDSSPEFWRVFALCDLYASAGGLTICETRMLAQFLMLGYMGNQQEWADIYLTAQIHSILYSLRVLKQLLGFSNPSDILVMELRSILEGLPPLHLMMNPVCQKTKEYLTNISDTNNFALILLRLLMRKQSDYLDAAVEMTGQESPQPAARFTTKGDELSHKATFNMYEILRDS